MTTKTFEELLDGYVSSVVGTPCAKPVSRSALLSAHAEAEARGARRFADWLRNETALRFDNGMVADGTVVQYLARFLAATAPEEHHD